MIAPKDRIPLFWVGSTIDERTMSMVLNHVVAIIEPLDIPLCEWASKYLQGLGIGIFIT